MKPLPPILVDIYTLTKIITILTLVAFVVSCRQQKDNKFGDAELDIKNGKVKIITYGFDIEPMDDNSYRQIDSLRKHYGFNFDNQGCIQDSLSTMEADEYNKIVFDHLSKKNGVNWYKNYQRQADSLKVYLK